ncbi:LysR family transcriptional regulator [Consotaella aegiceratis]|uniref:LysR family transcriptional regulator n=1 Tax=Consotaella aegiceratis TaxID=3097961 RepID=UPI002F40A80B
MSVFLKVADLGSFAAAAQMLDMSPQMVAKHVVYLEDRLGTALIHRTTRRHSLTDVGRAYYDRCKLVLAEAEAADLLAQEMHTRPKGLLRVNAPVTFGAICLAPLVTRYLAQHPEMRVDLSLTDRYVDVVEEGFEVIIRIGEIDDTALIAHPLAPYRLIACASPGYIARRGMPDVPDDLVRHDCLLFGYGGSTVCRWQFTCAGKSTEIEVEGRFRSNDWRALLHAAIEGYGLTLGPESVLAGEIAAGRLVRVLPGFEGPAWPMHAVYPAGRRPTAKVRSFIETLLDEYGAG